MLVVYGQMQSATADLWRIDPARRTNPSIIVERRIDTMGGEEPSLEAILIVLAEQCGRSAQSTRIGKRVIHLTALKECDVIGACNLIEAIERLEIADADQNILVLICPTREDIAKKQRCHWRSQPQFYSQSRPAWSPQHQDAPCEYDY